MRNTLKHSSGQEHPHVWAIAHRKLAITQADNMYDILSQNLDYMSVGIACSCALRGLTVYLLPGVTWGRDPARPVTARAHPVRLSSTRLRPKMPRAEPRGQNVRSYGTLTIIFEEAFVSDSDTNQSSGWNQRSA
ncbi:hypothetical protein CBL_08643 [Carabus blaptoides fortunei]